MDLRGFINFLLSSIGPSVPVDNKVSTISMIKTEFITLLGITGGFSYDLEPNCFHVTSWSSSGVYDP